MRFRDHSGKFRNLPVEQITCDVCDYGEWSTIVDALCKERFGRSTWGFGGGDYLGFQEYQRGSSPLAGVEVWDNNYND